MLTLAFVPNFKGSKIEYIKCLVLCVVIDILVIYGCYKIFI